MSTPSSKRPVRSTGTAKKRKATRGLIARQGTDWWDRGGRKKASMRLCVRCDAVQYDGHWHTAPKLAAQLRAGKRGKKDKDALCDECRYAAHGPAGAPLFEGELTLDGLALPEEKAAVLALVRSFGKKAAKRDPEDRIVSIDDRGDRVVVRMSENQMAAGMGKAIDSAFKGGKLRIVWSKDDLPARVYWKRKGA